MGFRNNTEAENLRLRNELREAQEKLSEYEAKAKAEKEIKKTLPKPPSWFATKLAERRSAKAKNRSALKRGKRSLYAKRSNFGLRHDPFGALVVSFMVLLATAMVATMAYNCYQYFTDITEGTVVGHEFVEEYEMCTRDDNGFEHCSDYGPYYILTIQDGSETAEWHVSEGGYSFYHDGDHYCYEDWFRGDCSDNSTSAH